MSVPDAWEQTVKSQVKPLVRALYSAGSFVGNRGDAWLFSVPNEAHGTKCDNHRPAVEAALSAATGAPVTIEFVSGGTSVMDDHEDGHQQSPARSAPDAVPSSSTSASNAAPAPTSPPAPAATPTERPRPVATDRSDDPDPDPYVPEADEDVDLSSLTDAPPESVKTPIDRLAEAFPGSELMADD